MRSPGSLPPGDTPVQQTVLWASGHTQLVCTPRGHCRQWGTGLGQSVLTPWRQGLQVPRELSGVPRTAAVSVMLGGVLSTATVFPEGTSRICKCAEITGCATFHVCECIYFLKTAMIFKMKFTLRKRNSVSLSVNLRRGSPYL